MQEVSMNNHYTPIPTSGVEPGIGIQEPARPEPGPVTLDSPAIKVMTDFRSVRPVTVSAGENLQFARRKMIEHKVRLLLVTDQRGLLAGLVTATDVESDRPVRIVDGRSECAAEVPVSEVMTPLQRLEVLDLDDVAKSRVGNVVATLNAVSRQHAMVVDYRNGAMRVRGLFSASQLSRQLGEAVENLEIAQRFSRVGEFLGTAGREHADLPR
jgi:CBS domain-containing protein